MTDLPPSPSSGQDLEPTKGRVVIKFHGDDIPGTLVIRTLESLERAIREGEEEEIRTICGALNLPEFVGDAASYRLRGDDPRYYITAVRSGSIEVIITIAMVTYYILSKTIGESVKAGYLDSKIHDELKRITSTLLDHKLARLAYRVRSVYGAPDMLVKVDTETKSLHIDVETKTALPPDQRSLSGR